MIDSVREAGAWAFALLFGAWFVLHFFLRSCYWGCRDSPLALVVEKFGFGVLVDLAAGGEVVLFVLAVVGLGLSWLRDRLPV
ncbi:hypothetical protein [Haloplanus aerogenes]|uniref:Uncharacterized protein n=1 Tax=Haloplanus aerogenes TaxID=660522 RepID=A0A3M0CJY7_9EURY|nr:hypothetical protein [Haloplanus aerogenes]AZH26831.1 hypothetical protein DU502_16265 [Haloplanus aerogenes]RMB09077.1 hypothetical protein ATH50_3447 [Haloplanus aerogenes]